MESLFAWLDQHPLQSLLVWFEEECQGQLSQQEMEVVDQVLHLRHIHGHASESDVAHHLRAQIDRQVTLYLHDVETPPHSRQEAPSLRTVAREASAQALGEPPGGLSYEETRALLDRVSQRWVWLHTINPRMPWPPEAPSLEQCKRVFRLVQAWRETALALPVVQDVIAFLGLLVRATYLPQIHRKAAEKLLHALLGQLVPRMHHVTASEMSIHACLWRYAMLVDYEKELHRLHEIMRHTRRSPANRLITLQEHYPAIPRETLQTWRANTCEKNALALVSTRNALTATTIRKVLIQARKERQHRQQAHPRPGATE
jgi:hypothetical protein